MYERRKVKVSPKSSRHGAENIEPATQPAGWDSHFDCADVLANLISIGNSSMADR